MGRSRAWTQRRADETARLLTLIEMGCISAHGLWWNASNGECLQHAFKLGDEDVTLQIKRLIKIGRVALTRGPGMERHLRVIEPKDSAIPPWAHDQLKMEYGTFHNITIKGPTDAKENSQTETDEAQRAHPDGGGTGGGGAPMV